MIKTEEVLQIHQVLIDQFGGSNGVRDMAMLESAIHRPFSTFGGQDLYESPVEKAAAIFESLIINHPFIDGNKRTSYVLMRLILMNYGLDISATEIEKYDFVIQAASGKLTLENVKNWINNHLKE